MSGELVSVIIPTCNRASTLKEAIESVLKQTYENFELLILDDFSTDNTSEVVGDLRDSRIKYIRHHCHIGLVANWTYGVHWATGTFFSILGDDDKYRPEFLSRRVEAFSKMPELVAVTGSFECCDEYGKRIRVSRLPCDDQKILFGRDLVEFTLASSGEWFVGATLYRTSIVRSMWSKICVAGTALDFSMHVRLTLLENARVCFVNDKSTVLRVHAGQESQRNMFYLAESNAKTVLELWNFEIGNQKQNRTLYRKKVSSDINHYGRMLWDRGCVEGARNMFLKSLLIYPLQLVTGLKLLRSFLVAPKPIVEQDESSLFD
jgi:glycosyltransferase involved in cell wall biosynthesis